MPALDQARASAGLGFSIHVITVSPAAPAAEEAKTADSRAVPRRRDFDVAVKNNDENMRECDVTGIPDDIWLKGLAEIRARAVRDPKFRQRCLSDAHGVIREVCGQEAPAGAPPVRFVEHITEQVFVLPPAQAASQELSERQLEDVVGGMANQHPGFGSICWVA